MDKNKILMILPPEYDYNLMETLEFHNEQDFKCSLNVKEVLDEDDARKWIKRLGECSLTTWTVRRTFPDSGRYNLFKIVMKCQHNVNAKTKLPENRKRAHVSKNTKCPTNLVLTIKRSFKNTKCKNMKSFNSMKTKWPCHVELNYHHNHPLDTTEVLRFKPLQSEIKEKLYELYQKGHTAVSALESLKLELFLDNESDFFEILADRSYVPSLCQVHYLFKNVFNTSISLSSVEELVDNYNSSSSTGKAMIGLVNDNKFVAICSPIMSRAHEYLPHSHEIAEMEICGNVDKKGNKICFINTFTPAGPIPLGCFVINGNKEDALTAALTLLIRCFPNDKSFYGYGYPSILITDNSLKDQGKAKSHWPRSNVLLSQHYVVKSAWTWLNCSQNVPKNYRDQIYYSIKKLIYCPCENELCDLYTNLISKYNSCVPKFVNYLKNIWRNRHLWCLAFRNGIPICGRNDIDYAELTYKIMKQCFVERIKNFNMIQMTDFILNHFEKYVRKRLLDFSNGKISKILLFKYIPPNFIINQSLIISNDIDSTCFYVPCESDYDVKYLVDLKHCVCSCENGKSGNLCKHICGVINHVLKPQEAIEVPQSFKDVMHKIAVGNVPLIQDDELQIMSLSPNAYQDVKSDTESIKRESILKLADSEEIKLNDFFHTIKDGLFENGNLFVPAVREMLQTFSEMKNDFSLASALRMFGKNDLKQKNEVKTENDDSSNDKLTKIKRKRCNKNKQTTRQHFVNILPKRKLKHSIFDPLDTPS